jgi:RNA polymerase sigma-70 factor (ECF subfamily)
MDDSRIIELFLQRSESAIDAVQQKYGPMCRSIARNLLGNDEDAQECVNDALHALWNTIPPQKPQKLGPFLAGVVRNLAMKRLTYQNAEKRSGMTVSYKELSQCIPAGRTVEELLENKELSHVLNRFLGTLDRNSRDMFLRRYWFCDSVGQIAKGFGISETRVTTKLYRIRKKLKDYLAKEAQIYVR